MQTGVASEDAMVAVGINPVSYTHLDVIDYQCILAGFQIQGIAVLRIPGIEYFYLVNGDVLA